MDFCDVWRLPEQNLKARAETKDGNFTYNEDLFSVSIFSCMKWHFCRLCAWEGLDTSVRVLKVSSLMTMQVEQAAGLDALPSEPTQILLTGANGFLGRFLLLDLLRRVSNKCVIAIFYFLLIVMDLWKFKWLPT